MAQQIPKKRGRSAKRLSPDTSKEPDPKPVQRPRPVDVQVGSRIRRRRLVLGIAQQDLAHSIGVSFQQVQKYESGANRVSASRLVQIAETLGVPASYFFEDPDRGGPVKAANSDIEETLYRSDTLDLIRAYYAIPEESTRKRVLELIKSMAKSGSGSR